MHTFEVIYLVFMMAATVGVTLVRAFSIGKTAAPVTITPGYFVLTLVSNALFVFWGLEILHKL